MKTKKISKLYITILAFSTLIPFSVSAIGQVTEPIHIKDGLKGEEIQEELFLINTEKEDVEVGLIAEGGVQDWVKFYTSTSGPIDKIMIPSGAQMNLFARILIPRETPNGEYKGNISIIKANTATKNDKDTHSDLMQKIDREITIQVSDDEFIRFSASIIPSEYDLNAGEPLDIRFIYDNRGNTSIEPQVKIKIIKDDNTIHNAIYPFPDDTGPIKPSSRYEIPSIEIPTATLDNGKYLAKVELLNQGKTYLEKYFNFSIRMQNDGGAAFNLDRIKTILGPLYFFLSASALIFIAFLYEKKAKVVKKALKRIY